jgi:hypothetical protein
MITGLSALGIPLVAQMTFATLVMCVLVFLIIRAKRMAKKAGHSMAEHLSSSAWARVAPPARRRQDRRRDERRIDGRGRGAAPPRQQHRRPLHQLRPCARRRTSAR